MPPRGPPSDKEIERIALRTANIIKNLITANVCVFGSAAAYLWADIGRVPHMRAAFQTPTLIPLTSHTGHRRPSPRPLFR